MKTNETVLNSHYSTKINTAVLTLVVSFKDIETTFNIGLRNIYPNLLVRLEYNDFAEQ